MPSEQIEIQHLRDEQLRGSRAYTCGKPARMSASRHSSLDALRVGYRPSVAGESVLRQIAAAPITQ